jgi:hypothetical protein
VFYRHFREWVAAACREWKYDHPDEAFYRSVRERLTDEILKWIGYGINAGLIREYGLRFNVAGNAARKRYKWFSERRNAAGPQCNWEYYVQVARFIRLWNPCKAAGLDLIFEDKLMDLAARRGGKLLWCIEVKEKIVDLEHLLMGLVAHGTAGVDLKAPDRGKDPLRKAKYLVTHQPEFFSGVATGMQRHFRVIYGGPGTFNLIDASPPLNVLSEPPPSV